MCVCVMVRGIEIEHIHSQMLNVWYIFTYIYHQFWPKVGKVNIYHTIEHLGRFQGGRSDKRNSMVKFPLSISRPFWI